MVEETPVYADGTIAYDAGIQWVYQPGAITPAARYQRGKLHYVVTDHQGTPREMFTENGVASWAGRLNTWGQLAFWESREGRAENDPNYIDCHFRFAGQFEDNETGLYYNRFRYYDKDSGQYISPDPIGLLGGFNPYGYVHNPVGYIEPLGLMCCPLITKGADVTSEIIQGALKGDTMQTVQGSVSLPAIQRYVDRLLKGDVAPPIKVDGNVIVEGNHRYVAGKIVGKIPETVP
ncbi:RHS repeat-associated core domain-containing protein, partial [Proteus sp. fly-1067]|uniref:RHS repeat-associated core domain-containing protein n=1 Tax=Proteus sp. fly-1067 TaxID=3136674 RepID=UPI0032DA0E18